MLSHSLTTILLTGPLLLLGVAGASAAGSRAVDLLGIQWSTPPAKADALTAHHTYRSAAMNSAVGYNLYLPPGYAADTVRYPVLYWLHGLNGNENSDLFLAPLLDAAIKAKALPPMILVFATGGGRTRYYDSLDRSVMAETTIVTELLPHIDSAYRTLATRAGRAIQGMSMGGMGTFKLAFKIGSDDRLLPWSENLHDSMVRLKISHEFEIVGGVGHDLAGLMRVEQLRAFRFAADHFAAPAP